MSDEKLVALLAALAATPYTDRGSRDAILHALERTALAAGTQSAETPAAQSEGMPDSRARASQTPAPKEGDEQR